MIQEGTRETESIFISGVDSTITEKDIKGILLTLYARRLKLVPF